MIYREEKDHIMDCYFYLINLKRIKYKNKYHVQYSDVPSAIRPIPHGLDISISEPGGNLEYSSDYDHSDMTVDDAYKPEVIDQPVPLTETDLNDLKRGLYFSKESVHLSKRKMCASTKCSTAIKTMRES